MDLNCYLGMYNGIDKSCARDYIKDIIQKDNQILFYNRDLKEWMVLDRQTEKRRFVLIFERIDKTYIIEFLSSGIPYASPLLKELHQIAVKEIENGTNIDCWCKHIEDWELYLNMLYMQTYSKLITKILEYRELPQDIIDNTLLLQKSLLEYTDGNSVNPRSASGIDRDINTRLFEIVKNICSLTHYIIIVDL
ncbi:hypothetical protein M9Y10_020680 [Tritrichomonas musculus]|uniref:Uncharacterized protein n=1 Tax=Tritrichomonas musculus TaxID=1915356 RepID=A0ABR2HGK8_9EUKA